MATMLEERVGRFLFDAACATERTVSITEIAIQAAKQGLQPIHFDRAGGRDALVAIACALRPSEALPFLVPEPAGWKGAVCVALTCASRAHEKPRGKKTLAQRRTERALRRRVKDAHLVTIKFKQALARVRSKVWPGVQIESSASSKRA